MGCLFDLVTLPLRLIWELIELLAGRHHHRHRGHRHRAPGCKRCGKRTPYKVCASCQKELKGIVQETAPLFKSALSLTLSERDVKTRKKGFKTTKKSLAVLNQAARFGVRWEELRAAQSDVRYTQGLNKTYANYMRQVSRSNRDAMRQTKKLSNLTAKYTKRAMKLTLVKAPDIKELAPDNIFIASGLPNSPETQGHHM